MSSPFHPPPQHPTGTSLSRCWLCPPCRHLILFLRYPPTNHKLPTAAAAVTATIAAADFVLCPHHNRCKEDNVVVAVVLVCSILVVIVNCSPALTAMGPSSSFSWGDGNWCMTVSTLADTRTGGFHHLLPLRRWPSCCVVCCPLASHHPLPPPSCCVVRFPLALPRPLCRPPLIMLSATCLPRVNIATPLCLRPPSPPPPPRSLWIIHCPLLLLPAWRHCCCLCCHDILLTNKWRCPSSQRKPQCFQWPWRTFWHKGRCWNYPLATLPLAAAAPSRWCRKGPPLAMNWSIRMAMYAAIFPPTIQPTSQPTKWGGGNQKLLAMGISMN